MFMFISLDDIIITTFRGISDDIIQCKIDRAILKGGRSSTKSQVAATSIVIGCMRYKESAVALVKHANKIDERLVGTFRSAIQYLGVSKWWKLRRSPFEYVLLDRNGKESNVSIKFTGADDAESLKSYRPRLGSFRYVWFEELTTFTGINEINNIIQTMARGQGKHCVIMTYNPPMACTHWCNTEFNAPIGKVLGYNDNSYTERVQFVVDGEEHELVQVIHHSTYLDVINAGHKDWLGFTFIGEAERSRQNNPKYFRWAYLGEAVGTDANVFNNISDWNGQLEDKVRIVNRGFDVSNDGRKNGDPYAFVTVWYDRINNDVYILNEFKLSSGANTEDIVAHMKKCNPHNMDVFIDSANGTHAKLLRQFGLNIIPVKKPKGSIEAGILWLKSLNHIYINKVECPNCYREFKQYEYIRTPDDEITGALPDKDNHFIDAVRYALSLTILYNN